MTTLTLTKMTNPPRPIKAKREYILVAELYDRLRLQYSDPATVTTGGSFIFVKTRTGRKIYISDDRFVTVREIEPSELVTMPRGMLRPSLEALIEADASIEEIARLTGLTPAYIRAVVSNEQPPYHSQM